MESHDCSRPEGKKIYLDFDFSLNFCNEELLLFELFTSGLLSSSLCCYDNVSGVVLSGLHQAYIDPDNLQGLNLKTIIKVSC